MSVEGLLATQRSRVRGVYRGWWIVVISYYTQLITAGAGGWVFGVLILSMQKDFGWRQTSIALVLTQTRWTSGFLSVPLGPYVDKHGTRLLMSLSAILAGVGLIIVGLSHGSNVIFGGWGFLPPATMAGTMYFGGWLLYGLAQPGVGILGPRVVISNWFVRKRAQAFVWFTLGSATAGIVAAPLAQRIDALYGWRTVWIILGLMSLTVAPLSWALIRRRPEDIGLLPDGDLPGQVIPVTKSRVADAVTTAPWTVGEAMRTRAFWLLTLGFLLVSMPSGSIFINISGFVQSHGFSAADGAKVVGIYGLGVLAGRPTWGFFLPRVGLYKTMVIFALIYAVSIAIFSLQTTSIVGIYLTTIWLGIAISGSQLLNAQALPDYFGREIVGRLTGYSQIANVLVAGSAPILTAFVFDRTGGYVPAFLFFAAACVVAAVAFFFSQPPLHPSEREPRRERGTAIAA